jgi:aminoglycoside phosphotransferase (APT) family kinase protein
VTATSSSWRARADQVPQDWPRLAAYLRAQGLHLDLDVEPRQFATGLANLNYCVSVDGALAVLRRPPAGPVAEGANDLAREFRVLDALHGPLPLVPRPLHLCLDTSVIGAPFEVIEHRSGSAIGGRLPDEIADRADAGTVLTSSLVTTMATLHGLDPDELGLSDLGRPAGFLGRQVTGWGRRADAVFPDGRPPALTVVVEHLERTVPAQSAVALLHGDLKFDNVLFDLQTLQPAAVVDWDMATRGDPLFDLAVLLSYWIEPDDPPALHDLGQVPSLESGFPSRRAVATQYFAASGRPLEDLSFHLTLARLRLAVAWVQLYRQYERGTVTNPRYATFDKTAHAVLDWTADTLDSPPL